MIELQDVLLFVAAYLIGSIPTSVWIGRRFYSTDVREHGSGNAGATNTLRTLGKKAGAVVLLIDIFKGWLAVALVVLSTYQPGSGERIHLEVAMAFAAIIGHIFPIYVGFKGGKGVATTMGIIIGISPVIALLCMVVFAIVLIVSHYVSLASMLAIASFPFWITTVFKNHYSGFVYSWLIAFSILLPLVVAFMHRKNILRLLKRQESELKLFNKKQD
ncbi:MAG TPA: glycerol-3-phosphate 1-O-acyltransferase PlsY [Bacteroidia bacterium]|jgi:glycerol-3-phosphate acyltransferase PlsY|nr:glycerol-3-phosphate 1-O-acyltransferase PlsY [Bacteroidia bacterium]